MKPKYFTVYLNKTDCNTTGNIDDRPEPTQWEDGESESSAEAQSAEKFKQQQEIRALANSCDFQFHSV